MKRLTVLGLGAALRGVLCRARYPRLGYRRWRIRPRGAIRRDGGRRAGRVGNIWIPGLPQA